MSCPVGVVQLRLRTRLTEKKSAQVHCCRETEALVFLLAGMMIVTLEQNFHQETIAPLNGLRIKRIRLPIADRRLRNVIRAQKDGNYPDFPVN